jgi:8-oxo-dGTP diphosphatase
MLSDRVQSVLFALYRRLPIPVRIFLVRRLTPSFHVGAMVVVERADGALLLLRQSYRRRTAWGFPGGLLKRNEAPVDAARREVCEEIGIEVELDPVPKVVIEPRYRRVDVIYSARAADGAEPAPCSPEVVEVAWFDRNDLPELVPEATTAMIELGRAERPGR